MRDPWFGHRDPLTFEPLEGRTREEWIDWDYSLVSAVQVIEDFTNSAGLLEWEVEPERMNVEAVRKIDKFQAAVDRVTSGKNYKAKHGERFVPRLDLRGGEWPTYRSFVEAKREEALKRAEDGKKPGD